MAQCISIRVPWHDSQYNGCVCKNPARNTACRALKNIASEKNDEFELHLAGCPIAGHEDEIPCVGEGGACMSPVAHTRTIEHPYVKWGNKDYEKYRPTELVYPPFSCPARPFGWTLKERYEDDDFAESHCINFNRAKEPNLGFESAWVQGPENQKNIFDAFFNDVVPGESLCFLYAKKIPFTDDPRRVIIGIGTVEDVIPAKEYENEDDSFKTSLTWETMICHSIRENRERGYIFPLQELAHHAQRNPDFNIDDCLVFADDEFFENFSYASEHVNDDATIAILLKAINALENIKKALPGKANWDRCIQWTQDRLRDSQITRGVYPGLGAVLYAFGFETGFRINAELKQTTNNQWLILDEAIKTPSEYFSKSTVKGITPTMQDAWQRLSSTRRAYLELLSRFCLTLEQARFYIYPSQRMTKRVWFNEEKVLENPYILYERTRHLLPESKLRISPSLVDRAVYPHMDADTEPVFSIEDPFITGNDKRRVRAYTVSLLENHAQNGHTAYPADDLLNELSSMSVEPPCSLNEDIFNSQHDFIEQESHFITNNAGQHFLQLNRFKELDDKIRFVVKRRTVDALEHSISMDWTKIIEASFGQVPENDETELLARKEKAAVLDKMSRSRLFVLVGGAGTGKTTLLSLLCQTDEIQEKGVTLLAPTGKARVRLSEPMQKAGIPHSAYTVAHFLLLQGLFDAETGDFFLKENFIPKQMGTVIIDECSMLTEEMMGTLLLALGRAERIIFVGDPRQLPPIGAGRPFVDLANYLSRDVDETFPRVGRFFGELSIPRRQRDPLQLELCKLYDGSGRPFDESLFTKASDRNASVVIQKWDKQDDLEETLLGTMIREIPLDGIDDVQGFGVALGGEVRQVRGKTFLAYDNDREHLEKLDDWQILTPIYGLGHGSENLNHLIHEIFQDGDLNSFGPEGITYGDKIINTKNNSNPWVDEGWVPNRKYYIANGEIGIIRRVKKDGKACLIASFATQPGISYDLKSTANDFEGNPKVELAYSLTVHKVQGSGFNKVILVIGEPCRLITRELLYTAITRQTEKLIILYNEDPFRLIQYASDAHSEIAQRITCLFEMPTATNVNGKLYEERLVHQAKDGELMRSTSETIIADCLAKYGLFYEHEDVIDLSGDRRTPTFTITDHNTGKTWYWEHIESSYINDPGWLEKLDLYQSHTITEGDNLIITVEPQSGPISIEEVEQKVSSILDL